MEVSFKCRDTDKETARQIADRAIKLNLYDHIRSHGERKMNAWMDVVACHVNGNPLRLEALLKADDFNFIHDIAGIRNCLNKETGKIDGLFSPRFSAHE